MIYLTQAETTAGDQTITTSQFSGTNLYEQGVDEADRLKFDGEYLYLSEESYFPVSDSSGQTATRIMLTEPAQANAQEIARIPNSDNMASKGLYFVEDGEDKRLLRLSATEYAYAYESFVEEDWNWHSGKSEVIVFDVNEPSSPASLWKIEFEGNLEGSRRIGNKLYLVSRFVPGIDGLNYNPQSDKEKRENELLIQTTPLSDLLPHYQLNNGAINLLVEAEDCLVAEDIESTHGYADIITLTSINLSDMKLESSICLNTNVHGIYSSPENIYLGASGDVSWFDWDSEEATTIHKFALTNNGVEYRASGQLEGSLGWADPSMRMSEYQDDLRVVTSEWKNGQPTHKLSILREMEGELSLRSQLPNDQAPEAIGKPGEDIFAVRFVEDKAYIVTYERMDPLYQLDLSNPDAPRILSELEMPGFSRYLHPISEGWLIGMGQHVVDNQFAGFKVELYDLRDPSDPQVKDTQIIGSNGSWSEVLWDMKAFSSVSFTPDSMQIAIPVHSYSESDGWVDTSLHLFVLDGLESGEIGMQSQGVMLNASSQDLEYELHWGRARSLLHQDAVYYLQGNQLKASLQDDFHNVIGPF
nr:beta-propeller domain-containing protein [Aliikangiella sp. G2MR2-5]